MTSRVEQGRKAVAFLVKATLLYDVDDDGFVVNRLSNPPERHMLSLDKEDGGKEIVIFQDPLPEGDYYLLNPYAEGAGVNSPPLRFLYRALKSAISNRCIQVVKYILLTLLASKEESKGRGKSKDIVSIDPSVLRVGAAHKVDNKALIDVIDDKMIGEFDTIIDTIGNDFVYPTYIPAQLRTHVVAKCLVRPDFENDFGDKVRTKTIHTFLALTKGLLQIDTAADLIKLETRYDPAVRVPPCMWTYTSTMLKLFLRFNDVMETIASEEYRLDLSVLSIIIEEIPDVFPLARNTVISTSASKITNTRAANRAEARSVLGEAEVLPERRISDTPRTDEDVDEFLFGTPSGRREPPRRGYQDDDDDRRHGQGRYTDERRERRGRYDDEDRRRRSRYEDDDGRYGRGSSRSSGLRDRGRGDYSAFRRRR